MKTRLCLSLVSQSVVEIVGEEVVSAVDGCRLTCVAEVPSSSTNFLTALTIASIDTLLGAVNLSQQRFRLRRCVLSQSIVVLNVAAFLGWKTTLCPSNLLGKGLTSN